MKNEIERLERMRNAKKPNGYVFWLVMIVCLVYITDEIASNICTQMKTEIANSLFSHLGDGSVARLETLGLISYPCIAISLFYRTLSDRFGRKPFLIINTLGMGLGMFTVFISTNVATYILGYCIISFFVPHDMQVVYIMESAPVKYRARIYSVIKCLSTLGVMLIPLFRSTMMTSVGEWRRVFLIPAVIGLISSMCGLLFAKETDVFIDSRLKYLKMTDEERAKAKAEKDDEKAQGGFFTSFRYSMKDKQLRRLYLLMGFFNLGFIITMNYQVMLSYGYAGGLAKTCTDSMGAILERVSAVEVTKALFLFPIGSALVQLIQGFISDKAGRKKASYIMAGLCLFAFLGFTIGARCLINPYVAGFLSGACVGSFWAFGDINVLMMSESAPTNLRASVLSSCYLINVLGTFIGMGILIPMMNAFGNGVADLVSGCIAVPGFIVAILILSKTRETKGTEL